jgi:DnaJ-class molecular chaperone
MRFAAAFEWFKKSPEIEAYSVLGVSKSVSNDEVKRAYRKMAMKHHPDLGGDVLVIRNVTEAYQFLRKKRGF